MNATRSGEIKCKCQHCDGNIAFDIENSGQTIPCPHCGMDTVLFIPKRQTQQSVKSNKTQKPFKPFELPQMGGSGIAAAMAIIGVLNFIGSVVGGFLLGSQNAEAGWIFFGAGMMGGLMLLGFAAVIENTKAAAIDCSAWKLLC